MADILAIYKACGQEIDIQSAFHALTTKAPSPGSADILELPTVEIFNDNELQASLAFVDYNDIFFYEQSYKHFYPARDYTFRLEGEESKTTLTGPLKYTKSTYDYRKGKEFSDVVIEITIRPQACPTFNPNVKQRIKEMGDRVAAAWQHQKQPAEPLSNRSLTIEKIATSPRLG